MHSLSSDFRRDLGVVTDRTVADLSAGWRNFDDPRDTRDWLTDFLLALTDRYGLAAAALAADYYEALRDDLGARKRFSAVTAEPPNVDQIAALARFAVGSLFGASPDPKASLSLAQGGSQRLVANTARQTVTLSSTRDPSARGWQHELLPPTITGEADLREGDRAVRRHALARLGCRCRSEREHRDPRPDGRSQRRRLGRLRVASSRPRRSASASRS
jgi:hypothetical protein